jgi:hypothetical protein
MHRDLLFPEFHADSCSESEEDNEEGLNLSHDGSSPDEWEEPAAEEEKEVAEGFKVDAGARVGAG